MAKRLFLAIAVLVFFAAGVLPLLSMLAQSVLEDGRFSLAAYEGLLTSTRQWTLVKHSLTLSLLVTLLTVGAGVPLGILLGRSDLPFRRVFTGMFAAPLLVPPYLLAVAWAGLLGEGTGIHLPGLSYRITRLLFGLPGCTAVLSSVFLPVPLLLTMIFLRTVDPRLEEAGRLVSKWRHVLGGITLPLVLPGILLSALLVFLLTLGEFSVPSFLRYEVFSVESFTQFSAFYDFRAATAATLPLAAITLVLLLAEEVFLRRRVALLSSLSGRSRPVPISLGKHRGWMCGVVAAAAAVLALVPLGSLLVQAGGPETYAEALGRAGDSLLRSFAYAAAGATLLVLLGFSTGYLIQRKALGCWRWVDASTFFLFALPGTVTGIGLISLWNRSGTDLIYGTPAIVLLGYLAKYTALTSRISAVQLAGIPPSMEEAAQIVGAGWSRRMAFVVAPLAWRGLVGGWLVGYIFSLRDTGITMLVYPPGGDTFPVRIFTLMANGSPQLIAALCAIMAAATLLPAGILWGMSGFAAKEKETG